jgi:GT2 family glycosyltransferase
MADLITVIVCTHNRPFFLQRCLKSLAPQIDEQSEVLVVDSAPSGPDSQAITTAAGARYLLSPRRGLDIARNAGLHATSGTIVAFTDDDVVVTPTWLSALRKSFADPSVACVTGRVLPLELRTAPQRYFEERFSFDRGDEPVRFGLDSTLPWFPVYPYHLGTGCNMAFRRHIFDSIGLFDPALDAGTPIGGGGDIDIFRRLLRAGFVAVYNPETLVFHQHRADTRESLQQFRDYGKTMTALLTKSLLVEHDMMRDALSVGACLFLHQAKRLARKLLLLDPLPFRFLLFEILGNLAGPIAYVRSLRQTWRGPLPPPCPARADGRDLDSGAGTDLGPDQHAARPIAPL